MRSLRDAKLRNELIHRLQLLTAAANPRWGTLDAPRMLSHLIDSLRLSLGELPAPTMNRKALHHFPLKHLILYVFPFPKGAPAARELFSTNPHNFDAGRRQLIGSIERLAKVPPAAGPEHPLFGPLTNEEWNALQWKHIAHHLKQFGC